MPDPHRPSRRRRGATLGWATLAGVAAILAAGAIRACTERRGSSPRAGDDASPAPTETRAGGFAAPGDEAGPQATAAERLSAGWQEAAEAVVEDARAMLDGRVHPGAFAEAQAEASRQELALHPPTRERLRRQLLGTERERTEALAALSAHPELDDELVGLVLREQRPEDDAVTRLLSAEVLAAAPAGFLSLHEDALLRAFSGERNPLVLAVALPALERLDEGRLQALLGAQLDGASSAMLPVLVGLARDRLGPEALANVGILVMDGDTPPSGRMVSR